MTMTPSRRQGASLSRVLALSVCLAVFGAVAVVAVIAKLAQETAALRSFESNAASITQLLAEPLGGAVRFGKSEILDERFAQLLASHDGVAVGVAAVKADGTVVGGSEGVSETVIAFAAEAASAGAALVDQTGELHAAPVRFGQENSVVGAVAIAWSTEPIAAAAWETTTRILLGGAVVALLFTAAMALLVGRLVARPLRALGVSVDRLAAGEDMTIAGETRRDEIGALARALRAVHRQGVAAQQVRQALDSANAMTLVVGQDGRVAYASPALRAFLNETGLAPADVDSADLALADLLPEDAAALSTIAEPAAHRRMIADRRVEVSLAPIRNKGGERLGAVVEWRDMTRTLALTEELDAVAAAAAVGDFSKRVTSVDGDDALALVGRRINGLCESVDGFLERIDAASSALAEGDLSVRLDGEDAGRFGAVARGYGDAAARLAGLIGASRNVGAAILSSSGALEADARALAGRASSQATSLEETAAALEEMATSVATNADSAADAARLTEETRSQAETGKAVLDEAMDAMRGIERGSERVKEIISVINDIAFQTNLLALNAAVEAARAGPAGRGFAIVASEVRSLAQRCADAAQDVSASITDSSNAVTSGASLVRGAGDALSRISASIDQVAERVADISGKNNEQATGVREVSQAVASIDGETQAAAALAEKSAAATRSLRAEVAQLSTELGRFHLAEDDSAGAAAPERAA